ncbi:MAG: flavodoxin family protein [Turicibacter sp.]|nr:flavodoxin family protein [Turicibacter sp.]
MKKVIAISSSGRKRNTYRLIESTRDLLEEAGIELEIIHLADVNIRDCRGCDACILTDKCPVKDEVTDLLNRMQEADGLILTSPVYMAGVSGQLKRLLYKSR